MAEVDRTRLIEARARAMWPRDCKNDGYENIPNDEGWAEIMRGYREQPRDHGLRIHKLMDMAEATLAADVALGLAVVPVEPTEGMQDAVGAVFDGEGILTTAEVIHALIEAGDLLRPRP